MAGQVLLVADRSEAVIQPGQPPAQMGAWLLDIPDGSNAANTADQFANDQGFPIGTIARFVDVSSPGVMETYQLNSTWVPVS